MPSLTKYTDFLIVNSPTIQGCEVEQYFVIVRSHVVDRTSIISEMFASFSERLL